MAGSVHIRLLGGFDVSIGARSVPDDAWRLRKARSLVKLLALEPEHRIHRERACELLWPGRDARSAANNLHQALHAARRALDAAGGDGLEVLTLNQGMLGLADVSTDVELFTAAAGAAREGGEVGAYWEAAGLYTGPLLPEDLYEDWTAARRESLNELQTGLLVELAGMEREGGHGAAAAEALEQALAVDELHEPATRELMRLLTAEGRRQEALAAYQRLRGGLRSALEADPDPETRRLYRSLLAGSLDTAADDEAAATPSGRRHNLPHEPSSFIGRERELREVARRLDRTRLLTLIGAGGVGKTRLAQETAAICADQFEHGVWLVELAALSDEVLIASAIGAAVGLDLPDGRPPLAALVEQLADRHALIVLDNCEHLIEACAAAATQILRACPGVSVLATSRQPLRIDGEVAWRVPSLALPDPDDLPPLADLERLESVRFFCERAAAAVPGFSLDDDNARAVAELCVRLDGVPLALELAAARIALLSPAELAERLVGTLDALGEGSRARLSRQRTLTATLDWSHNLLDDEERVLFRRLAVFAGAFSLEAVEGVCAMAPLERESVIHPLGRLVEKSLVVVERDAGVGARYRLLETVRQYARERLRDVGELEVLERNHLHWYATFAQAHDPELTADRLTEESRVVEAEHDNLRAALRTALASAPEDALRLATSLWRFWLARGYFAEGRRWLDAALQAAPAGTPARARALNAAAVLDMRTGDFTNLDEMGDEVIRIHRRLDDPTGMAQVLHFAGIWDWITPGRRDRGRQRISESAALARDVGATHLLAAAEHTLGLIELGRGETGAAREHVERSRELIDEVGDVRQSFLPAVTLGWMPERGDGGHRRVMFAETVVLGHRLGKEHGLAFLQSSLAWIAWREDDLDRAQALASESAARFRDLGWDYGEALALSLVGNVERRRGEFDAARRSLTRSLDLRRALGDRRATGVTLGNLGVLAAARGDLSASYRTLREALELFERTEDAPGTAGTLLNMAVTAERGGDIAAARDLLEQSLEGSVGFGAGSATGWMAAMAAELAARDGDGEVASTCLADARAIFEEFGDREGLEGCARVAAAST